MKTPLGCTAPVQRNTSAPWTNQRSVVFCPIVHWSSCVTTKELCEHSVRSSPIYVLLAKQHLQVAKWEGMQHLVQILQLHVARLTCFINAERAPSRQILRVATHQFKP